MQNRYRNAIAVIFVLCFITGCYYFQGSQPEEDLKDPQKTEATVEKEITEKEDRKEEANKSEAENTEKEIAEPPKKEEPQEKETPETEETTSAEAEQMAEPNQTPESADQEDNKEPVKNTPVEIVNQFSNQEEYHPEIDIDSLSQEAQSWGFKRNKEHQPVTAYYTADLPKYGTYYLGNTNEKVVYLTFDEGYENGFTSAILDTLKDKQVKAAFFITGSYLKHNPELVKRMREEGHLVANHSQTHPDFTTKTDEEVIAEVTQVGDKFKELTGTEIDPFFRFPSGRYTERDLYIIRKLGYRNIFWSMAYKDWEVNNQPGKEYALNHVKENYHPGAIILLHAVSSSNTEALAEIITELDDAGYRFGSLYELE